MRMKLIVLIVFFQLMAASATLVHARGLALPGSASTSISHSLSTGVPGGLAVQENNGGGADKKALDINITVGEKASNAWYSQPIWIAMFVLGGVVLVVLLAMAFRGSGTPTVVKA